MSEELDRYDAGSFNDFGGGNVQWWQDYLRAELERAHGFYQDQLDRRTPAPSSEVERAVRPYLRVVEAARLIGTAHSSYCATVHCNCVGHDKRRAELADALELLAAPIPEEKPSPLEEARSAVSLAKTGIELALMKNPGLKFPDAEVGTLMEQALVQVTAALSALSGPAKGGEKA